MATVQIRNLDDRALEILKERAAHSGRSLQEYLRLLLEADASSPSVQEVLLDARSRLASEVSMADIVKVQREGRAR